MTNRNDGQNVPGVFNVCIFSSPPSTRTSVGPIRRLRSILQCVTCQMIYRAADGDVQDLAQAVAESPQWFSKKQVSLYWSL